MNISGIINMIENNPELIEVILEALGHFDVRDRGRYYQCSNLDGDNHTAISILKEGLFYNNYTRGRKGNTQLWPGETGGHWMLGKLAPLNQ